MVWRAIMGIVAGLVAWTVVATILNFGLRLSIPGYVEAEPIMAFTLTMKIARLLLSAISCLVAGAIVRWIAPAAWYAPWIAGVIVLGMFLPVHIKLWHVFPVWYHLTFLLTLVPLFALGGKLAHHSTSSRTAEASAV